MRGNPTVRTALAFAIIGPAVGALVVIVPLIVSSLLGGSWRLSDVGSCLIVLGCSYVLAAAPAAFAGVIWATVARRLGSGSILMAPLKLSVGGVIGAGVAAATGAIYGSTIAGLEDLTATFAICGAIAGALLALMFPRALWLVPPSNNRIERRVNDKVPSSSVGGRGAHAER